MTYFYSWDTIAVMSLSEEGRCKSANKLHINNYVTFTEYPSSEYFFLENPTPYVSEINKVKHGKKKWNERTIRDPDIESYDKFLFGYQNSNNQTKPYIPALDILKGFEILWHSSDNILPQLKLQIKLPEDDQKMFKGTVIGVFEALAFPPLKKNIEHSIKELLALTIEGNTQTLDSDESISKALKKIGIDFAGPLDFNSIKEKACLYYQEKERLGKVYKGAGEWIGHVFEQFSLIVQVPLTEQIPLIAQVQPEQVEQFEQVLSQHCGNIPISFKGPNKIKRIRDMAASIILVNGSNISNEEVEELQRIIMCCEAHPTEHHFSI